MSVATLPILKSGTVAKFPATFVNEFNTTVVRFVNDMEQRWPERVQLNEFTFEYTDVNTYDANLMREFWVAKKGMFLDGSLANTFSITDPRIPNQPYDHVYFMMDDFVVTENKPNRVSFTLMMRQARP